MTSRLMLRTIASDSSVLHAIALCATALAVFLQYGFWEHPIYGDRAYFIYQGQTVLRGESIYAGSFFGYPPVAPLLSGAAMWVGRLFDLPSYLAPRFAGLLVGVANPVLLYWVTRRATGSAAAGGIAGLTLIAFAEYGGFSVANLEPKALVLLFWLLASLSLQGRHWLAAGCASGLAGMCWQPAILVSLATSAIALLASPGARLRSIALYSFGVFLGLLPTIVYLTALDAWLEFWQRSVVIPAQVDLPGSSTDPTYWLRVIGTRFTTDQFLFVSGALGLAWFTLESIRSRAARSVWFDPRFGAFPILTILWMAFSTIDFQGTPDMMPILLAVAFWTGWLAQRVAPARGRARRLIFAAFAVAICSYGFLDAALFEPRDTLARQQSVVARMLGGLPSSELRLVAFDAEAAYVIAEVAAPIPYLRMNRFFIPFVELAEPDGCQGVIRRILALAPDLVVIRRYPFQSECVRKLARILRSEKYVPKQSVFSFQRHKAFFPRPDLAKRIRWRWYRRSR